MKDQLATSWDRKEVAGNPSAALGELRAYQPPPPAASQARRAQQVWLSPAKHLWHDWRPQPPTGTLSTQRVLLCLQDPLLAPLWRH